MGTSQGKLDLEQILVDLRAQHLEAVNQLCSSPKRISWRDIWAGHFHGYAGAAQIHLSMYIHEQFLHCSWGPPFLSWWKEPQTPLLLYVWGSQVVLTLLISTLHFVHPLLSPQQGLVANLVVGVTQLFILKGNEPLVIIRFTGWGFFTCPFTVTFGQGVSRAT